MKYQNWLELSSYINEIDQLKNVFFDKRPNQESIAILRQAIISQLQQIKETLDQSLDSLSVHHTLFALTAMLDEEIQLLLNKHGQLDWPPMQQVLFQTSIAGEVFFKTLDELLDDQKTPSLVYEVIYFAIKRGFKGRYLKSPNKIASYMALLEEKLPETTTVIRASEEAVAPLTKVLVKPWHCYAAASLIVLSVYFALYATSNGIF